VASLGKHILEDRDHLVQMWYERWRSSPHPHHEVSEREIKLEVSSERALEVEADPQLFRDVLDNLVDNAVQYTATGFVRVVLAASDDFVLVEVADSGRESRSSGKGSSSRRWSRKSPRAWGSASSSPLAPSRRDRGGQ
jgi:hypothetical protein